MASSTILVVEDDPVILDLLAVNFELEGYVVVRAVDGEDGLAQARAHRPDVIVTDVMMPKRSGIDLLRDIRAEPELAPTPVILLSAKALATDVRDGLAAGADDYITKPFEPDDLLVRVEKLLAR
jgi:DNA-binding response OmpR family regulator